MRILQTLFFILMAYFLLMYLWPLFLLLFLVILYQLFKARRLFKQTFQQAQQPDPNPTETFRQDGTGDVIDAEFTERSHTDGPQ